MSTGLDCYFEEQKPNEWYLFLEEEYGYKNDPNYDKFGPFTTLEIGQNYLHDNFANPGGYGIIRHPEGTGKKLSDE